MNKLKCLFLSGLMAVMPVCMSGQQTPGEKSSKPRVIITCDPELDDLNGTCQERAGKTGSLQRRPCKLG